MIIKDINHRVHRFSMELMKLAESAYFCAMVTPAQSRAARGLLDWSQQDLADEAGIGIVTVRQLEGGANAPRRATLEVVRRAFESAGVEFIEENGGGPGVRLRARSPDKQRK
jgi:transcriptional regulator with XRE-family HTH domain